MDEELKSKEIKETKEKLKLSVLTFKERAKLEDHLKTLEADN